MYVYMYICMYVCIYIYICMYVCMYVCIYVCMYVCMYVYIYIYACLHLCMPQCGGGDTINIYSRFLFSRFIVYESCTLKCRISFLTVSVKIAFWCTKFITASLVPLEIAIFLG